MSSDSEHSDVSEDEDDELEIEEDDSEDVDAKVSSNMLDRYLKDALDNINRTNVDPNITRVVTVCNWIRIVSILK